MPLVIRALTYPDGTAADTDLVYVVSGTGASGYARFPAEPWDTILVTVNAIAIPDRDFANAVHEPIRSMLAEFVERGFVSVFDTTILPAPGAYLTPDQIRDYS